MKSNLATHRVFAENLTRLMRRVDNKSRFCAEMGINRAQLSRYMSGQSWPKPNVAQAMCRYFGVDARVLLEPLEARNDDLVSLLNNLHVDQSKEHYRVPEHMLPNGLYLYWRESVSRKDMVFCHLVRVFQKGDSRCWKSLRPKFKSGTTNIVSVQDREINGNVLLQGRDLCVLLVDLSRSYLTLYSFQPHIVSSRYTFVGFGMNAVNLSDARAGKQAYRHVMEYVGDSASEILDAARKQGFYAKADFAKIHPLLRAELSS